MKNCLLVGLNGIVVNDVKDDITKKNVQLFGGGSLEDVQNTFKEHEIEIVIMGAGLPLGDRLSIVQYIFEVSNTTSVHMKDWDSGPEGFLPFVNRVLAGLCAEDVD